LFVSYINDRHKHILIMMIGSYKVHNYIGIRYIKSNIDSSHMYQVTSQLFYGILKTE
jgi:hypothetical protein